LPPQADVRMARFDHLPLDFKRCGQLFSATQAPS
jgi:hypothetical protein